MRLCSYLIIWTLSQNCTLGILCDSLWMYSCKKSTTLGIYCIHYHIQFHVSQTLSCLKVFGCCVWCVKCYILCLSNKQTKIKGSVSNSICVIVSITRSMMWIVCSQGHGHIMNGYAHITLASYLIIWLHGHGFFTLPFSQSPCLNCY